MQPSPVPRAVAALALVLAVVSALVVTAAPAGAHASFLAPAAVVVGTEAELRMDVPHERGDEDVNVGVAIAVPSGWQPVSCATKATWSCAVETSNGRKVVRWTKVPGSPPAEDENFRFVVRAPNKVGPGSFPTVQTYSSGHVASWIGEGGDGAPPEISAIAADAPQPTTTQAPVHTPTTQPPAAPGAPPPAAPPAASPTATIAPGAPPVVDPAAPSTSTTLGPSAVTVPGDTTTTLATGDTLPGADATIGDDADETAAPRGATVLDVTAAGSDAADDGGGSSVIAILGLGLVIAAGVGGATAWRRRTPTT